MLETVMNINKLKAMKLNKKKLVYMNELGKRKGGNWDWHWRDI
jgi:hypothetical protein